MSAYQSFTVARATEPDPATLQVQLRALDGSAGVQHVPGSSVYVVKKATAWTAPQIAAAAAVLEAAPVLSGQLLAQAAVDTWPIEILALVLALIDQLNVIRAALPGRVV